MKVAIVPAGQWGTALAVPLADNGHQVTLWFRQPGEAAAFQQTRENARRLAGVRFPASVQAASDLAAAVAGADLVVLGPASPGLRELAGRLAPLLAPAAAVVCITKGLEPDTDLRMSQVILAVDPALAPRLAVLSGPNFAVEVARRLPTATVVAAASAAVAEFVQGALATPHFRPYTHHDVTGVELGGALKNVIAIGVGIADGMGMGDNARAALITRGIAEISRLGVALGADAMTFAGLSGIGDLVLTCTGDQSRNRQAGLAIGRGAPPAAVLAAGKTIEGAPTARAALDLARRLGVAMPITEQIAAVLFAGLDPRQAVQRLMTREATEEWPRPGLAADGSLRREAWPPA